MTNQGGTLQSWENSGNDTWYSVMQDTVIGTSRMVVEFTVYYNVYHSISQTVSSADKINTNSTRYTSIELTRSPLELAELAR